MGSSKYTVIELGDDTVSFGAGLIPIMVGGVVSALAIVKVQLWSAARLLPDKSAIVVVTVILVVPSGSGLFGINTIVELLRG